MAIAPIDSNSADLEPGRKRKSRRRQTAHLKQVPPSKQLRETIRAACVQVAAGLDKSRPLSKDEMEQVVRNMLKELDQPDGYVGWTMVMLASEFWRDQVAAVPHERRLFLLPHCLKHAEGCPADYDQFGLDCKTCGACSIADYRTIAEEMGYKVLVAEGSPIVMKIIVSGHVDAIVGVACLNVLEKAIDKIILAGIPCMAVPLLSSDCRNTSVDEDWVHDMIQVPHQQPKQTTRSYVHLMRAASAMFEPQELTRLIQPQRKGPSLAEANGRGAAGLDPIAATEKLAIDFLARGGKYSRPFTTLAVYDALTGGEGTSADGAARVAEYSDSVKRTALAIETFHKASLVHDDIEDDDAYRYGEETIHRKYGVPTAINLGDYMIGLGYRLVSRDMANLGSETAGRIIDCLADAHMRLSEGQGAELLWRDASDKSLKPLDALKIYALKTSPAFEAALQCGVLLSQTETDYSESMRLFARHVGVAFQILNDLKDWRGDSDNKMSAGGDVLGGRPTVLWALALEQLDEKHRTELIELIGDDTTHAEARVARVRQLYTIAGVFDAAERLVEKYRARAEEIADQLEPEELRRLTYYLIDTILDDPAAPLPQVVMPTLAADLAVSPA
ncbi:MAG: polyprenyl synthetase family protein [Blastopirellula sp. JB062]